MDLMNATIYSTGNGRMGYARFFVEVNVRKGFPAKVKVVHRDAKNVQIRTKHVNVEYSWKPNICESCKVFGHNNMLCKKRVNDSNVYNDDNMKNNGKVANNSKILTKGKWTSE
ncbi:hypothetical protein CTI12_AA084410 [Artemisia annua]|uniref:Zinc knuckle CX2CX4HX4C n=1 Tax=Artemisia annua TaxID=35608 RepID=A0A2U1Q213_ARTAN|nr:hypothetical protein CTI12_AA084410 [Artemisia annua]